MTRAGWGRVHGGELNWTKGVAKSHTQATYRESANEERTEMNAITTIKSSTTKNYKEAKSFATAAFKVAIVAGPIAYGFYLGVPKVTITEAAAVLMLGYGVYNLRYITK